MMKIMTSLWLFTLLVACSFDREDKAIKETSDQQSVTLQQQIENVMQENNYVYDEIIDLDIIDDFIYTVSLNHNGGLDLAIMKYEDSKLKWVVGDVSATILNKKDSRYMYMIQPDDSDVTQVNVFGKPAKAVTYYDVKTEDFTRKIKYWIAYTEKEPTPSDVEYLKD
ncbi:hypothetical protein QNH47_09435 [Virgibacillus halodenitrificans]|uniref:hypothetical protein n=1 Tax=Virgibacillus halodenitrificans TaxID=1482 RepID=UPI0024BFB0DD|nr:hypothetical protein [Virgibacillus halodenitrificans]WHX28050.1 hypothetical protein QNH47_09435 [Virgibacillus halodenitrificans]